MATPDTASLDGPRAKLKRAHSHLEALYEEINAYKGRETHDATTHKDDETGEDVAILHVIEEPKNPDWGLILGDFLTNLRSTLDHLVWQLVILSGNKPSSDNQFPVAISGRHYWSIKKGGDPSVRDFRLRGVDDRYRARIDEVQPYRSGGDAHLHPLAVLARFNNTDKHRVINASHIHIPVDAHGLVGAETSEPGGYLVYSVTTGPLEDGAEILRTRRVKPSPDAKVKVQASIPLEIGFGDPGIQGQGLNVMFTFVRDLIRAYRSDFGEPRFGGPPGSAAA